MFLTTHFRSLSKDAQQRHNRIKCTNWTACTKPPYTWFTDLIPRICKILWTQTINVNAAQMQTDDSEKMPSSPWSSDRWALGTLMRASATACTQTLIPFRGELLTAISADTKSSEGRNCLNLPAQSSCWKNQHSPHSCQVSFKSSIEFSCLNFFAWLNVQIFLSAAVCTSYTLHSWS